MTGYAGIACILIIAIIRVLSATARKDFFADILLAISLSSSNDVNDVNDANDFAQILSSSMTFGRNGTRLALLTNVINYRTRVLVHLAQGRTKSAFSKLRIEPWKTTDNRLLNLTESQPIFDRIVEDVFDGKENVSGDRAEAPNIIIFYSVQNWPSEIFNKTIADIVIVSTGSQQSSLISKIVFRTKDPDSIGDMTDVSAAGAMATLAQKVIKLIHSLQNTCPTYRLTRTPCFYKAPEWRARRRSSQPKTEYCPCLYNLTVQTVHKSEYCPKSVGHLPCDYEDGSGCQTIVERAGANFPTWILWTVFLIVGVPLVTVMCCGAACLCGNCLLPLLLKELAESAVFMALEKALVIAAGGDELDEEEGDEGEWEDEEEEEEEETWDETEEKPDKKKRKEAKKKKGRKKGKRGRGKKRKGKRPRVKAGKLRGGKLKRRPKAAKMLRKTKMSKAAKFGKMTPKSRRTLLGAAKRFKGRGKMIRKARPIGRKMAAFLLKILKVLKWFRKLRGK